MTKMACAPMWHNYDGFSKKEIAGLSERPIMYHSLSCICPFCLASDGVAAWSHTVVVDWNWPTLEEMMKVMTP